MPRAGNVHNNRRIILTNPIHLLEYLDVNFPISTKMFQSMNDSNFRNRIILPRPGKLFQIVSYIALCIIVEINIYPTVFVVFSTSKIKFHSSSSSSSKNADISTTSSSNPISIGESLKPSGNLIGLIPLTSNSSSISSPIAVVNAGI